MKNHLLFALFSAALLLPDRAVKIVKTEESCLRGAALAAFAKPMEHL